MLEPSDATQATNVTRLLLKAVGGLPEDEQRVVFEHFFERGIGSAQTPAARDLYLDAAARLVRTGGPEAGAVATMFTSQRPIGPDQIMIPVRLSEAQHRRLKEWSAQHGFPMAVIVRGLIERFLDGWDKRSA